MTLRYDPPPGYTENEPHAGQRAREAYHPPTWRMTPEERTQIEPPPDYEVPGDEQAGPDATVPDTDDIEEPIPVTIVDSPAPREAQRWASSSYPVNSDRPTRIAGHDLVRRRLVVRNNDSTNSVFLLAHPTQPTWAAFELTPGDDVEMLHNEEVWALCADTETASASVISEFAYHE